MKSMFWGIAFILIGAVCLLNYLFGINLPIFKILIAVLLIYWGLSILLGSFSLSLRGDKRATDREAVFSSSTFRYPAEGREGQSKHEYVTIFGESTLDLRQADVAANPKIEINTVFGETKLLIKKDTPLRIETNTVLGKSELPEKNMAAMGTFTYKTPQLKDSDPALNLKVNVVFGSLKMVSDE